MTPGRASSGRGTPQSRKWIRSPSPTATVNPSGSSVASGSGTAVSGSSTALGYERHAEAPPRLPNRPWPAPAPARHRRFEDLVAEAVAAIPMPFAAALDEVAIVIEDEPSRDQLTANDIERGETLYGLYEGVPRTEWGADWVSDPNRISLFRLPLEADFADPDDLADEVWLTVVHELAHHLGIDEDRLHELGVD